ncbi:hypothetical protein IV203_015991 [Nitzschia inconspicua]|uniref:Uncharacterized protein n=1 Tax=Nitzschia inconspicua TaxID=303405 RepID=A0A9K3KPX2_9STRA|nr:hypothetical protein IV203_015991 [Nitzschia inconspicua]
MSADPAPAFPAATGVTGLDQALGNKTDLNDDHMRTREHESQEEADDETYEEEISEEESYDIDDQESAGVDESAGVHDDADDHDSTKEDDMTETGESTGVEETEHPNYTGVEDTNAHTLSEEFRQAEQEGREAATTSENAGPNTRSCNRNRRGRGPRNSYTLLMAIMDTFNPITHR